MGSILTNSSGVVLPAGTTNHGNPHLVCFPARWSDTVTFFLGNYAAHAATVLSSPGRPMYSTFTTIVAAFLFPVTGVSRGFRGIFSGANFAETDLRIAARAGALCSVIRTEEYARNWTEFRLTEGPDFIRIKIHGRVSLPEGYGLAIVPSTAKFQDDTADSKKVICSDWSLVRIIIAIAQVLFGIATLYRTKGDQVELFGYAAFGLTVIQYTLMSLINLVGNLISPRYPTMYLIRSSIMSEAEGEGATVEGVVGELDEDEGDQTWTKQTTKSTMQSYKGRWWSIPIFLIPLALNILIIWIFSRFRKGQSSHHQRVLLMTWLGLGNYVGLAGHAASDVRLGKYRRSAIWNKIIVEQMLLLFLGAPIVGAAFWVVVLEIQQFGICRRVG